MTVKNGSAGDPGQATCSAVPSGFVLSTLPSRAGDLAIGRLIDLYLAHYTGRDTTRLQRLSWWSGQIGQLTIEHVSDDDIHAALEVLVGQRSRYFAGTDADGRPIYRAKRKPLSPASINRYCASIAAVFTWAIKRRIAPKGWDHPCRRIERLAEHNEQTRYLSDEERSRLLGACKSSAWPKLYLLVLMALTTGARKSELLGLRWQDIDTHTKTAHVGHTKNGDPRLLPLVPFVLIELQRFVGKPQDLIFASSRRPKIPYSFEFRFAEALGSAHIRDFRFHDLRHSCASYLAKNGATLLEIGDVLGHRQLQVTKRYAHLATGHKAALVARVLGDIS